VAGNGEQSYVQSLRAAAAGAPVDFVGYLPPAEFFRQVHYTVVPSEWNEPFARVVIESFAHGVPVLASSAGGLPEAMMGRETGLMFRPAQVADLVRCLLQAVEILSSDDYGRMRQACRKQSQNFDPEQVTRKYAEIYRTVCATSGASAMAGVHG
jgi:glycogen synthase